MKEKVLHISCGGLGHGGISTVIFSIVETLHEQFDFDCVVFHGHGEREKLFQKYGRLFRIQTYTRSGKRKFFELLVRPIKLYYGTYKICKNNPYRAIHCHNNEDEGFCLLAAKRAGVPVRIAHSHNTASPKKKNTVTQMREWVNRKLIQYAATDRIGCSQKACEDFFGESKNTKVVYNAVDLSRYCANERTPHEKLTFIHVGRYTYQKNQEMAIRVFDKIRREKPNSRLLLVGYGEDKEKLEQQIQELGLESSVELIPGGQADVKELYAISDYMIFPSNYEGFGIVLIEAQAMGIPCFVSEAVQEEADVGLLTYIRLDKGDDGWARAILDYINKPKEVDVDMVASNLQKYSNEAIGKQYASVYKG